jgi:peptidylprolyl isomerase
MLRRAVIACVLVSSCTKADPPSQRSGSGPASAARPQPKPAEAPRPTRHRTAPALPAHSDANPPGVPRLDGELRTERGVQYLDEVVGTGPAPAQGKSITVHYTGWLTDGTQFDSSRDRGEPIVLRFDAGQVIPGWDIGLGSMRVGGKRRLIIPSELGYGANGAGEAIPPDSTLVFDVELVAVEGSAAAPATSP